MPPLCDDDNDYVVSSSMEPDLGDQSGFSPETQFFGEDLRRNMTGLWNAKRKTNYFLFDVSETKDDILWKLCIWCIAVLDIKKK